MASYGTIHRPNTPAASASGAQNDHLKDSNSNHKGKNNFKLIIPCSIPATPEAAAARIIRNLGHFGLYYALFVWLVLFITLVPMRKVSLVYLVAMTYVTSLYFLLLREFPDSFVLHKIIDKRLVLSLLAIGTAVELIVTRAGIHLFVTLAATMPIVLLHAALKISENMLVNEDASGAGELVLLVSDKAGEDEPEGSV